MGNLAAAHLSPGITIPLAAMLAAFIVWYWLRLGQAEVPDSRRRIRRASLLVMAAAILPFIRAASFLDPDAADPHERQDYIVTWTFSVSLLMLVVLTAMLDVFNTMRLQRRHSRQMITLAAQRLGELARRHDRAAAEADRPGGDAPA